MTSSFLINEIYPCLQGEGINLGKPSLLVRFQICNLRCTWCDTPYTHTIKSDPINAEDPAGEQQFTRWTLADLCTKIKSFPQNHLILSGGEPTLHNLAALMRTLLQDKAYTAEVESNGTRIPHKQLGGFLEEDYRIFQWNISPKFSNAGEKINEEALSHWAKLSLTHEQVYFKFVIRDRFFNEDLKDTLSLINEFKLDSNRVILMPEGTDIPSQIHKQKIHDACLEYNFRYSPRLHILLFGNLRGV